MARAAEAAGLGELTVRRAIRRGQLRASDVSLGAGRPTWRVRRADLDHWLRSRANTP